MKFSFYGVSTPSSEHPDRNEDAIAYNDKDCWAAVLDGVGGTAAGQEASNKALEVIKLRLAKWRKDDDLQVEERLKSVIEEASLAVSKDVPDGLTTALVSKIVRFDEEKIFFIASVGDSRAYLFRKGALIKITQDDSIIPKRIAQKFEHVTSADQLNDLEGKAFMLRSIVTQAVGQLETLEIRSYSIVLMAQDKLVLTTDGIHDNLTFDEIEEVAANKGNVAKLLVEKAKTRSKESHFRSKPDDISAIVIEVH